MLFSIYIYQFELTQRIGHLADTLQDAPTALGFRSQKYLYKKKRYLRLSLLGKSNARGSFFFTGFKKKKCNFLRFRN